VKTSNESVIPGAAASLSRDNAVRFQRPFLRAALWQIANSLVPCCVLWSAMVRTLFSSLEFLKFGLWDERLQAFVGFSQLKVAARS
jgi:hypothetical protein